jgi:hypothetical protein
MSHREAVDGGSSRTQLMTLIIYYVVLVLTGTVGSILISLWIERMSSPHLSMTAFLGLYFFVLWLAWPLAVRLTAPKDEIAAAKTGVQPSRG